MLGADGTQALRGAARDAFVALHQAMQEAATTFGHEAVVANALIEALDREPSIAALAARFPISEERSRLVRVLDSYEVCRRDARLALWRLLLAEGCSIGEISRMFGLSRQLVSRQLRDHPAAAHPVAPDTGG